MKKRPRIRYVWLCHREATKTCILNVQTRGYSLNIIQDKPARSNGHGDGSSFNHIGRLIRPTYRPTANIRPTGKPRLPLGLYTCITWHFCRIINLDNPYNLFHLTFSFVMYPEVPYHTKPTLLLYTGGVATATNVSKCWPKFKRTV